MTWALHATARCLGLGSALVSVQGLSRQQTDRAIAGRPEKGGAAVWRPHRPLVSNSLGLRTIEVGFSGYHHGAE